MKYVVVTGFTPFGGDARNPSGEIAVALDRQTIDGYKVVGAVLPCEFGVAAEALRLLLDEHQPELVVCLGLAGTRNEITPERIAINVDDARIPDNGSRQPVDEAIVPDGPVGYWSTLPIKAIVEALREDGVPSSVSQTAGTFVCNHVFYALMHELRRRPRTRGGFIHVPWPMRWAKGASSISFPRMVGAIETAVAVSLRSARDVKARGGAVA